MESRKHLRINKNLISQIIADNVSLFVITSNLSANGLFLRSKRYLPANSFVAIEIVLPDNSVSSLRGIVRRTINNSALSGNGMGIEIIEKDSTYIEFMKSILNGTETNDEETPTCVRSEITFSSTQEEKEGLKKPQGEKRQRSRYILNDNEVAAVIGSYDKVKTIDISAGGISFKTEEKLDHNKQYIMHLNNKNRNLTIQGALKWISLDGYKKLYPSKELLPIYTVGMQFTNFLGHTSDEVMQFIDSLAKFDTVSHCNDYINLSDLILT